MKNIKVDVIENPNNKSKRFIATLEDGFLEASSYEIYNRLLTTLVNRIADDFIREYEQEIISKIDMQALSNIVVASAGGKINETLNKKLPDRIDTIVKTDKEMRFQF